MKNIVRLFFLLGLSLSLVNCKVKFSGDGIIEIEEDDEVVTGYTGDLKALRYYRGGWYPAPNTPNFAHELVLKINDKGKINAHLKLPECEIDAVVTADVYAKLEKLIVNARVEISSIGVVDIGHDMVTLTYPEGEQDYHLAAGDSTFKKPVIIQEDAKKIRQLLEDIIDAIKNKKINTCAVPVIDLQAVRYEYKGAPEFKPDILYTNASGLQGYSFVSRDITLKKSNGKYYISGREDQGIEYSNNVRKVSCFSKVTDLLAPDSLVDLANQIKIQETKYICLVAMIWPNSGYNSKFTLNYTGTSDQVGYLGCWHEKQALNTEKYTSELLALFRKNAVTACH